VRKRVGWLHFFGMLNNAGKVTPAQNPQNAIGLASMVTALHNDESHAQVMKSNY